VSPTIGARAGLAGRAGGPRCAGRHGRHRSLNPFYALTAALFAGDGSYRDWPGAPPPRRGDRGPVRERQREAFPARTERELGPDRRPDPERAARAVFALLARRVSRGET
jgi:hypothetical protein